MTRLAFLTLIAALGTTGCHLFAEKQPPETLYALAVNTHRIGAPADALRLYEQAAAAGSARAQLVVALHHATKRLPTDLATATASTSDDVVAGSSPWFETALVLLERDALNGNTEALVLAGLMHEAGRGTPPNRDRATSMLASAAKQGSAEAHYWLARLAEEDRLFQTAANHYEHAIDKGDVRAFVGLGLLHINGHVSGGNYARGMALLRVAKEKGLDSAGSMFLALLDRTEKQAKRGDATAKRRLNEMRLAGVREATPFEPTDFTPASVDSTQADSVTAALRAQ